MATYTIATTGFLANGGDGYAVLPQGEIVRADQIMGEILFDEFKALANIKLPKLNRQVDISE